MEKFFLGEKVLKTDPVLIDEAWPDEVVILNLTKGVYYSLRGSGICVWPYLKQGVGREEVVRVMSHHFVEVDEGSVTAWIEQMMTEGVVLETEEPCAPLVLSDVKREPFTAPQFQVFQEMKDLLLLDPIHDTNEAGWPHQAVSSVK